MSTLVVMKFKGDTETFRRALTERAAEFTRIADAAQGAGGVHHRFGIGDGEVVVMDEWESVAAFQKFFSDPGLQEFIGSVGAAPEPREIIVSESVDSADQY